jgi:hypothetical protein
MDTGRLAGSPKALNADYERGVARGREIALKGKNSNPKSAAAGKKSTEK